MILRSSFSSSKKSSLYIFIGGKFLNDLFYQPFIVFDRFKLREIYLSGKCMSLIISRLQQPIFTHLGSLERPWLVNDSKRMSDPKMGLWPSPDSKKCPKFYNFGHDSTLLIRNVVLMIAKMLKSRLEPKCLVACVSCRLEATKIYHIGIMKYIMIYIIIYHYKYII
jgi:hypothetical protein